MHNSEPIISKWFAIRSQIPGALEVVPLKGRHSSFTAFKKNLIVRFKDKVIKTAIFNQQWIFTWQGSLKLLSASQESPASESTTAMHRDKDHIAKAWH